MTKKLDLNGQVFGRLTVIKEVNPYITPGGHKASKWLCECECGNTTEVLGNSLRRGRTSSCGCYNKQLAKEIHTTHGQTRGGEMSKTYRIWSGIKGRCLSPKNGAYKNYGGRGITICDRWLESFDNFLEDMGERPSKSHSIDRIDVDGNYCKENCRWATPQVQAINQRTPSNNTSGVKGVSWDKRDKKWRALIAINKKKIHLGCFLNIEDAVAARLAGEEKYHKPQFQEESLLSKLDSTRAAIRNIKLQLEGDEG